MNYPTRLIARIILAGLLFPIVGRAEMIELRIDERKPFADGKSFGETGPYEIIKGVARYAVDPSHKRNDIIVDLGRAPKNKDGRVVFEADVFILAPKNPEKGNGAILYDVNNRGNKLALRFFNSAPGNNDPKSAADAGNGFLLRRGYTVVWCGWIGELLPGNNRLLMKPPVASLNGKPITGVVRYEMVTDTPADTLPLSRREGHGSYSPTKLGEKNGTLTWRMREKDERVPIPRAQWSLERQPIPKKEQGVQGTLGQIRLRLAGGFRPGYVYELICEAEGPIVQGVGFVAVRDLISFLRYNNTKSNPFLTDKGKSALQWTYGFGVSQCGRFLRHFLYEGFNVDERDRRAFDGLIPHVAGGGLGFFNHRFAQPTRHNGQHEEHLYPADVFPFTYGEETDPYTKRKTGIQSRLAHIDPSYLPKVMHTQSAAEYWHRAGSLVHTDPMGKRDAVIPDNVRIYSFGGTQHGPASDPPSREICDHLTNPADYSPFLRALLDALDNWARKETPPPPSAYPTIKSGTLVSWDQKSSGFPALPGVRYPEVIQQPDWTFFGSRFLKEKIITIEPPEIRGHYVVKVPKSDKDGNDLGTLLVPDVAVPLATYTGWNLRRREFGAEGMLASLKGAYLPFAKTKAERTKTGDPRLSVSERYGSFEKYRATYAAECARLVKRRYLLQEDADRLIEARAKKRDLFR